MKKILWVLVTLSLGFGGILFYNPSENKAQAQYRSGTEQAVNYVQQKKKKSKKYYRSVSDYSVTGDASDSDAAVQPINSSTWSYYYRRVPVPGLKISDPYPFRVQAQADSVEGFTEDHWGGNSSYFITDGYLWQRYGYTSAPGQSFTDLGLGNYRYFNYYGGTKAKKRKKQAYKYYEFTASGDENNADTTGTPVSYVSSMVYYYRKVTVPELDMDNLADYRVYQKNSFYSGFTDESWTAIGSNYYFITDGYLYVAYGYKTGASFYNLNQSGETFRLFLYSDGKRKKNRLTKQYVKRYAFNVANDQSVADKISSYTSSGTTINYYYKRVTVPEAKNANFGNLRIVKKNSFTTGYSGESWSPGAYQVTDGYIWIAYGMRLTYGSTNTYFDYGSGDYQIFLYK